MSSSCCSKSNTENNSKQCSSSNTSGEAKSCHSHSEKSEPSSTTETNSHSCCPPKEKFDFILWGSTAFVSLSIIIYFMVMHVVPMDVPHWLHTMSHTSVEMFSAMWWGVLLAIFFVGLIGRIPRDLVMSVLGQGGTKRGLFRATGAGLLLDLCSHGILMVGMRLYERGASIGQVMAFLIASPWNSFSLTLIMFGLIGVPLTMTFIIASAVIAILSGWLFEYFVKNKILPSNPNQIDTDELAPIGTQFKSWWAETQWQASDWSAMLKDGLSSSRMVLRWLLFGIVLVSIVRVVMDPDNFAQWFGASISGLFLTLLATTLIEVCSEGSTPIAADLVNRANAPGNGFVFLMAGVATDYTEIMSIKDTMSSWKIALFLPLVTVPQVILIGWLLNQ